MAPEEALALKIHTGLSDDCYQMIKNNAKLHNADIYQSLHKLYEAKQKCYPNSLYITGCSAKCSLQDMIEHTISRVTSIAQREIDPSIVSKWIFLLQSWF